jgi:hypothetical protein
VAQDQWRSRPEDGDNLAASVEGRGSAGIKGASGTGRSHVRDAGRASRAPAAGVLPWHWQESCRSHVTRPLRVMYGAARARTRRAGV